MKLPDKELVIAVDLDGTLAKYRGWSHIIGTPLPKARHFLQTLHRLHYKILIYTTRGNEHARTWLRHHRMPFDYIGNNPNLPTDGSKPVAHLYVDDRSIRFTGDFSKCIQEILRYKAWWNK